MNSKHKKTLAAIFSTPVPKNIEWAKIEALLVAVGCVVTDGGGSRVKFDFKGHTAAFHRPHPQKETKPYAVRLVREYLKLTGIKP